MNTALSRSEFRPGSFADSIRSTRIWAAATGVVAFALLTALAAQVRLPLPHTPVPVTFQTLSVALAGITLGPALGTASMCLYLLMGLTGFGVFAVPLLDEGGGLGPTAGYLLGFVAAQPIAGFLAARFKDRWLAAATGAAGAHVAIFALGLAWLSIDQQIGLSRTLEMGLYPFVVGTLIKIVAAAAGGGAGLPHARRLLSRP